VLQLQHPKSHRKAVLLQADMDVDADGSDGDRMPAGAGALCVTVPVEESPPFTLVGFKVALTA